jgi:hypothetical protein
MIAARRKMLKAGRRRARGGGKRGVKRRRNNLPMLINPSALLVNPRSTMARKRRRRKGGSRARRRGGHLFKRGHRPWNKGKRQRRWGKVSSHDRRVNPRRHRRRRRNPGVIQAFTERVKDALKASPAAMAGGIVVNALHGRIVGDRGAIVNTATKVAFGAACSLLVGKFLTSNAGTAFLHGSLGAIGADLGAVLGGGFVATSKPAATKGIAALAIEDEGLLQAIEEEMQQMGVLITGIGESEDGVGAYSNEDVAYSDLMVEGGGY